MINPLVRVQSLTTYSTAKVSKSLATYSTTNYYHCTLNYNFTAKTTTLQPPKSIKGQNKSLAIYYHYFHFTLYPLVHLSPLHRQAYGIFYNSLLSHVPYTSKPWEAWPLWTLNKPHDPREPVSKLPICVMADRQTNKHRQGNKEH